MADGVVCSGGNKDLFTNAGTERLPLKGQCDLSLNESDQLMHITNKILPDLPSRRGGYTAARGGILGRAASTGRTCRRRYLGRGATHSPPRGEGSGVPASSSAHALVSRCRGAHAPVQQGALRG